MTAPTIDLDSAAVMSYGGLVDASTVEGQVDEESDFRGAITALLDASGAQRRTLARMRRPYGHPLADHRRSAPPPQP